MVALVSRGDDRFHSKTVPAQYDAASGLNFVGEDTPPTLLHGERDELVSPAQTSDVRGCGGDLVFNNDRALFGHQFAPLILTELHNAVEWIGRWE